MPKSASRSIEITVCRSSRFFDDTRTVSPCTCACTPFGPSAFIRLTIALAFSSSMPCRTETSSRELPPAAGSGSLWSSAFSDTDRLTRRSLNTSRTARTRSSLLAPSSTASSPFQVIDAPVPLKSNRCPISFAVWLTALSTSWCSTLLTTSNVESATVWPPLSCATRAAPLAGNVCTQAGCPSGQRERSVKPSAQPTLVRTQHPPRDSASPPGQFRSGILLLLAPLAQSAERLHGKEKVYGSIP